MIGSLALHKIVSAVLLPPLAPALAMILGTLIGRTLPRVGGVLFLLGFLSTVALSLPIVEEGLASQMEDRFRPVTAATPLEHEQAIVILGGGRILGSPEYQGDTVSALTLEHVRYGARLAHQTGLPVLVCGGKPTGGHSSEADLMADVLAKEYGVEVRWREGQSNDTEENAANAAAILKPLGVTHVLLVTDVIHMTRARVNFEEEGFQVRPAPTGYIGTHPFYWTDIIPAAQAYAGSTRVLHEWLGLALEGLVRSHSASVPTGAGAEAPPSDGTSPSRI